MDIIHSMWICKDKYQLNGYKFSSQSKHDPKYFSSVHVGPGNEHKDHNEHYSCQRWLPYNNDSMTFIISTAGEQSIPQSQRQWTQLCTATLR